MKVINEHKTIAKIAKEGCSVSRFGSGELKLCLNMNHKCQPASQHLSIKLKEILKGSISNLLVAVPRFSNGSNALEMKFWRNCCGPEFEELYDPEGFYGSSFITRPDMVPEIDNDEYWQLMRQIWDKRSVMLLQGAEREFERAPNLLNNASDVRIEYGPRKDAFQWRYTILKRLMCFPKDVIIVLSLGVTATVLAHDLTKEGYQVLDLGHAGAFYSGQHPKSSNYDGTYYDTDRKNV